jgi:aromatic ring-opening dioxygenase catalytic subunit (LigB family)
LSCTIGIKGVNSVFPHSPASIDCSYDYYGFPPESYKIKYDAPGAAEAAGLAVALLKEAGLAVKGDAFRPLDHGSFIPLKLILPEADVPVFQVSLMNRLHDVATHMRVGAALAPLRDQGVLIVGSGFATHNLGDLRMGAAGAAPIDAEYKKFTDYVNDVLTSPKHTLQDRVNLLLNIAKAPNFRLAHPREEHLMPLIMAAAAAIPEVGPALGSSEGPLVKAFRAKRAEAAAIAANGSAAPAVTEKVEPSPFKATLLNEIWGGGNMAWINYRFD